MALCQSSGLPHSIRFATELERVVTFEGVVIAKSGDAVVTGSKRESWPVPREAFFRKYTPIPGVVAGEGGLYIKWLAFVQARQLDREETIDLSDGRGTLTSD
jgi:hypothetical protein